MRRGLQGVRKSRAIYGLSLKVSEMRLELVLGQAHLASQNFVEADATFQNLAEVIVHYVFLWWPCFCNILLTLHYFRRVLREYFLTELVVGGRIVRK